MKPSPSVFIGARKPKSLPVGVSKRKGGVAVAVGVGVGVGHEASFSSRQEPYVQPRSKSRVYLRTSLASEQRFPVQVIKLAPVSLRVGPVRAVDNPW